MATENYYYDDNGIRVKKVASGATTYYVNQYFEENYTAAFVTKYYYFNGQRIAMKMGSTLTYLHSDHLGSTVLETNTSGNPTNDQKYRAYGNQRDTAPVLTPHKFTGQKLDTTGLYYMNARYYDPAIGAFISPDTMVPDATNLFDYNRYMYVRGNPLRYNDPSGHGIPYLTGGGSCTQIGMCYTMLSPQAAAKQEAEVVLAVQATASVFLGDANDVVTVATGYDVIGGESVPYFSQEWAETLAWAVLPFLSHSGIRAADEIIELTDVRQGLANVLHQRTLGLDPAIGGGFRAAEAATATRLESVLGTRLVRDITDTGDWMDTGGRIYDAVGPAPSEYFNLSSFTGSINRHLNKQGLHRVVVDFTGMESEHISQVQQYLGTLSQSERSRVITLGAN